MESKATQDAWTGTAIGAAAPRAPGREDDTGRGARLDRRRGLCAGALETLRTLAAAGDDARPGGLVEAAGRQADAARAWLSSSGKRPAVESFTALDLEFEELRCHLHDTTLQVLEYLAAGGYGLCTDVATIREVAERAASDLAAWLELPLHAEPASREHVAGLVRVLAEDAERLGLPRVQIVVADDVPLLDDRAARALRGAVRESLTNVRRHARARGVWVTAAWVDGEVVVLVSDDGVGFAAGATPGMGLPHSIARRLASAGGAARVMSSDRGTHVQLRVRCTA